jgi:fumarate hydratase subunit alpha
VYRLREIHCDQIEDAVFRLCIEANYDLPKDLLEQLQQYRITEESNLGKQILDNIIENASIAEKQRMPICQDTGMAVLFVEIGQDVQVVGGYLEGAIEEGVRKGYKEGYLRKSIVEDPLHRKNTNDNTPAIIHYKIVKGDKLSITAAPKGGGSENMSALKMLKPSDGAEGVKQFVMDTVEAAGPNACPPFVIGVGIGGDFELAPYLAKKALLRPVKESSSRPHIAQMEKELLEMLNQTGIGPQGLGGTTTAVAVNIETYPTHIATLPVAVNIGCHVTRHKTAVL